MKEYSTDSGAALPEVDPASGVRGTYQRIWSAPPHCRTTPAAETFAALPLHLLVPSLTNPRKTFDQAKLLELAESIRASSVHQPILVRPLPGSRMAETFDTGQPGMPRPTHEIVAGERRYRASVLADARTIPAMIRHLTDAQVLEIQLVENLQRADLSELEEAEGYERLMQHSSLNADEVGAKIGKSRSYVYARLKLLDLCLEAKTALRAGHIDASRALLIARIPDGKLQIKAVYYASATDNEEAPSVRELQTWLRQNVMLPLDRAPFQITDARLVEAAGSCKDCPKRTGANPDIFADVLGADICTDPGCYQTKASTHSLRNIARAEAKGMRYISGAEAKAICYEKSSTLNGYSPLSQVRADAGGQRLDQLLGKNPEGAVLIENPWTLALIEAVPTDEAEGVLLAKGLVKAVVEPAAKADKLELEIDLIKRGTEREINVAFNKAAYSAITIAMHATPDALASALITPQLVRAWLTSQVDNVEAKDLALPLQMTLQEDQTESQHEEAVRLRIQAADSATLFRALAVHMLEDDRLQPWQLQRNEQRPVQIFGVAAADKCIDLPGLRAQITQEVKAKTAAQIAEIKAKLKPAKPVLPTTPLAQPSVLAVAGANPSKAKPAPLRKPRLSAREAQSGIAEAMQGIEASPSGAEAAPLEQATPALKTGPQANSQAALAVGFAVGQRVKVTSDLDKLSMARYRFAGKQGTITAKMGDSSWDVTFRGRGGGLASFDAGEIEVVQS